VFEELLAQPGVREVSALRSRFGFMAYHGGNLERGTDVIASEAAEQSGSSLYAVIQPPDLRWHLPSTDIDPDRSATLATFLDHVDFVLTVHGFGRHDLFTTLLLGGGNRALATHVGAHLRPLLPDYDVIDTIGSIPRELRGLHPDNPANRPRRGGVQLELPPRVRGLGPYWADRPGPNRSPHTEALITGLATAARAWIQDRQSDGPQSDGANAGDR
jgi:phage replication-related protein YjqB (UPF0714/DUF867 family)